MLNKCLHVVGIKPGTQSSLYLGEKMTVAIDFLFFFSINNHVQNGMPWSCHLLHLKEVIIMHSLCYRWKENIKSLRFLPFLQKGSYTSGIPHSVAI